MGDLVPNNPLATRRAIGLRKLGVSEDEVLLAEKLIGRPSDPNKTLAQQKALRLLGVTEEEVDLEKSKVLGTFGIAGRKRSFAIPAQTGQPDLLGSNAFPRTGRRHTVSSVKWRVRRTIRADRRRRRSSDSDLVRRSQQAREIELLRDKVEMLERRLTEIVAR